MSHVSSFPSCVSLLQVADEATPHKNSNACLKGRFGVVSVSCVPRATATLT